MRLQRADNESRERERNATRIAVLDNWLLEPSCPGTRVWVLEVAAPLSAGTPGAVFLDDTDSR